MENILKLPVEGIGTGANPNEYYVLVNLNSDYIELPITKEQYQELEGGISKDTLIKCTIEISGY